MVLRYSGLRSGKQIPQAVVALKDYLNKAKRLIIFICKHGIIKE